MGSGNSVTVALGGPREFEDHDGVSAVLDIYARCLPAEKANGISWYWTANRFARKVSALTSKRPETVAAILARISPQITWAENKKAALEIAAGDVASAGYPDNIARAYDIAAEDSEAAIAREVLPTSKYARPKISAFYRNIANPETVGLVTVDTWAARIWVGDVDLTNLTVSAGESSRIQADYTSAAHIAGLLPQEIQAITWVGAHRIKKDKGQHSLFEVGLVFKI